MCVSWESRALHHALLVKLLIWGLLLWIIPKKWCFCGRTCCWSGQLCLGVWLFIPTAGFGRITPTTSILDVYCLLCLCLGQISIWPLSWARLCWTGTMSWSRAFSRCTPPITSSCRRSRWRFSHNAPLLLPYGTDCVWIVLCRFEMSSGLCLHCDLMNNYECGFYVLILIERLHGIFVT